ncbi:YciI family protein [Yinghuangia soli]|uniref:YciI family protein n=1 Tax=Yinghuangia soli TaxID=2908204 RepID=A0AA41PYU4_9ACTN|nr:YciI family protein [Yinghuangia soli]MCF2527334.1 YciI family protein [Yinghuangia soli]
MQFLLIAFDGVDEGAAGRRLAAREAHIELGDEMVAAGRMLFGTAILDDEGRMIGSMLVLDFPSRAELDAWFAVEPYVTGKVWERVDIRPCAVGPSFRGMTVAGRD